MSTPPKKIAIAAGGTAGHVVPALAVAAALRAERVEVEFFGGKRAEAQLVPAAGFPLHTLPVEGLSRSNPRRAARALARAAGAFLRARTQLARLRPDAVMGGGGYVAGPVGLAALSLGIPLVLTEADSHLGLTNRLLAPFARRVCLAFPIVGREGPRYRVTGRPISAPAQDRPGARERFGIGPQEICVLVFGGSLGARSINLAAVDAFATRQAPAVGAPVTSRSADVPDVLPVADSPTVADAQAKTGFQPTDAAVRVLHVCGARDYPELARHELPAGYDLREYLPLKEFLQALAAADLAVARSGGSVFELVAHGLPAILVPYPHASGDHQSENARWMVDAGAAIAIPDGELSGQRLSHEVAALLADRERLAAMASAASGLARPHAAEEVADELLKAIA
jgi:UDP-N-acetylglucosamine--N-acetylmuramyl-(pentapeptide) pyrophosphoryl-undecaprenol N-acetylglucosamine transferase